MEGRNRLPKDPESPDVNPFRLSDPDWEDQKEGDPGQTDPFYLLEYNRSPTSGEYEEVTRVSGNDRDLLRTMTDGNIRSHIMKEARKNII